VKISTDRSTIHILDGATGTERKHVSLGQDRVQKVFSSPDGAWSVAVFKVRGAPQYGILAVDLKNCEEQDFAELPSPPLSASFEGEAVILKLEKKDDRHLKLKNRNLP
jgi:hypothetical protein